MGDTAGLSGGNAVRAGAWRRGARGSRQKISRGELIGGTCFCTSAVGPVPQNRMGRAEARPSDLTDRFDQDAGLSQTAFAVAIELHVVEPPIVARLLQQLAMRADLFDVAFIQDHDLIG